MSQIERDRVLKEGLQDECIITFIISVANN